MATGEQIASNRRNAARSTGPRATCRTRLNGLKHGLRSPEAVLPGEDPAAFRAHRDAWMDDWQPTTMARAQLVEDAAVAAWRKKRCARVEAARITERVDAKMAQWRRDEQSAPDRVVDRLPAEPREALATLLETRAGIDRLIAMWGEVAEAAESAGGWGHEGYHFRPIALHGHCPGDDEVRALRDASWRLLLPNMPEDWQEEGDPEPWGDAAEGVAAGFRRIATERIEALRALRAERPDRDAARARQAEAEAFEPRPEDASLWRYEGQLTRQFHKALSDLVELTQTGADLVEPADEGPLPRPIRRPPSRLRRAKPDLRKSLVDRVLRMVFRRGPGPASRPGPSSRVGRRPRRPPRATARGGTGSPGASIRPRIACEIR